MTTLASDRQLAAGALLALVSGAASAATRTRHDIFAAAQTGNQVRLSISLAAGEWDWVGVYAAVIGFYMLGVALGLGYLHIASRATRWVIVLSLAAVFVLIDVLLTEVLTGADASMRALLATCSAFPLGAQYAITKRRLGAPTTAMTGNLERVVDVFVDRLGDWWAGRPSSVTHETALAMTMPLLFTVGALGGVEIEKNVAYALSVLAPFFALGVYVADLAPAPQPEASTAVPLVPPATTGKRLQFVLAL